MLVAAIDIGTNSVLLLIARTDPDQPGELIPLHQASTITRLGEGVDRTRRLGQEAVARTLACLRGYAAEIERHGVSRVGVVSTSAARDADGVEGFLTSAQQLLGVRPQVISGEREAGLTFQGALSGLACAGPVGVFDIGGGSTEVILGTCEPGKPPSIESARSLDIGCVRLTERHLASDPPTSEELHTARMAVEQALSRLPTPSQPCTWIGIGGTITTLGAIEVGLASYDAQRIHGTYLTAGAVLRLRERLAGLALSERQQVAGLAPKRADVIVAGALLLEGLLSRSGQERVRVSDRGVRWGLAFELAGSK